MSRQPKPARVLLPALVAAMWIAAGCGGGGGPTEPSGSPRADAAQSYVGSVSLPGNITGVVLARTTSSLASRPHTGVLFAWLDLIEPKLLAQGGASGVLTLSDGTNLSLTGTHTAGSFQLSAAGGYSVTASVSNGQFSGTVTTPGGTGGVTPLVHGTPAPPPGNITGIYEGTYDVTVNGYFRNVIVSSGVVERDCGYRIRLSGTLSIDVKPLDGGQTPDRQLMEFGNDLTQRFQVLAPCPAISDFSVETVVQPGRWGSEFLGDAARPTFGRALETVGNNNVRITETEIFVGVLNGTAYEGRFMRSRRDVGRPVPNNDHFAGYANVEATVTLHKR